ncbi:MAG: gluconate 2-dehydrogenase subunit 3 family protein [Actinomycetota bacterium]|nr:gluconate 2-dehydrogenase subunit 3 family protein [Actinomycetota bacterium]
MARRKKLKGGYSRRQFLAGAAKTAAAGAAASAISLPSAIPKLAAALPEAWSFTNDERATLRAAIARIVPADGPGDWSAVDAGADNYIAQLLSGDNVMYAGGWPAIGTEFQDLSRVKEFGWHAEIVRLRGVYRAGLADLDARAGTGSFANAPAAQQEAILRAMDLEGSAFFAALYDHTMEGVYSHPVYGGNTNRIAWDAFGYQGDVHGVRYSSDPGPWQTYGGYSPGEMSRPGEDS